MEVLISIRRCEYSMGNCSAKLISGSLATAAWSFFNTWALNLAALDLLAGGVSSEPKAFSSPILQDANSGCSQSRNIMRAGQITEARFDDGVGEKGRISEKGRTQNINAISQPLESIYIQQLIRGEQ